jgi:hypothetical protein
MEAPIAFDTHLCHALDSAGLPWLVIGSFAGRFYGLTRKPNDIDVLAHPTAEEHLRRIGFQPGYNGCYQRNHTEVWLAPIFLAGQRLAFDLDSEMQNRCLRIVYGSHAIPVASLTDWVAFKLLLYRQLNTTNDLRDVQEVLSNSSESLDSSYLIRRLTVGGLSNQSIRNRLETLGIPELMLFLSTADEI